MKDPIPDVLLALGACDDARLWCDEHPHDTWEEALAACPHVEWALWLADTVANNGARWSRQRPLLQGFLAATRESLASDPRAPDLSEFIDQPEWDRERLRAVLRVGSLRLPGFGGGVLDAARFVVPYAGWDIDMVPVYALLRAIGRVVGPEKAQTLLVRSITPAIAAAARAYWAERTPFIAAET